MHDIRRSIAFDSRRSSPRLAEAVARVVQLQPSYARATRTALARGDAEGLQLMSGVDAAREAASHRLVAYRSGRTGEREALEAFRELAHRMQLVVEVVSGDGLPVRQAAS